MRVSTARVMLVLATAAMTTAACTGGATTSTKSGGSTGTIRYLIGQPDDPATVPAIKADLKKFESQNKGIKVKLEMIPSDTERTVLQTRLRSGNGPDVFGYDTGPGFAGVLAKAGLLYDLTGAYKKYDWKIYDWAKQRVTFNGKVLGVPNEVEELGIYYNKTLVPQQPKNLGELESTLQGLKGKGVIPMTFSDKEGWEGGHLLSAPLSSMVGADGMKALLDGKKPWNSPEVVKAIDLFFRQFNQKGFLPKSPTAITYDNSNALFYKGRAAMNPTGTWLAHDVMTTAKFQVGFMPFPAENGPGIPAGGLGSGTFVSAKTQHPDAALKFMNYLNTPEHGLWQVATFNHIPAYPIDTSKVKAGPLFQQILADTSKIASGQGQFGYNIDVLTTDVFNKAMWDGLQQVLTGKRTPQQVADDLQKAFQQSKTGG